MLTDAFIPHCHQGLLMGRMQRLVVGSLVTNRDRYDAGDHPNIVSSNEITFSAGGGVTTTG